MGSAVSRQEIRDDVLNARDVDDQEATLQAKLQERRHTEQDE